MQESFDNHYNPDALRNLDADFISVECLEKLGLDENPFTDHARDPFLFIDQQLEMSVNVIVDYLQNQNSTLVLLGEIGIGKTTYLRVLLRKGYQHFNFCTLRAKPETSFAEIETKIKERWRLPQSNVDEPIQSDEYIKTYLQAGKHPVLIVDDAHRLQNQALDALLHLKHRVGLQSPRALGLVLASEPGIQTQLSELEQRNPAATRIYQINVRTFSEKQCADYINYRLDKAGADKAEIFSPEQVQEIYNQSKGLPRIINKLAREALAQQCQQEPLTLTPKRYTSSTASVRLGIILAGLIGLVVIIGVLFKKPQKTVELDLTTEPKSAQTEVVEPNHKSSIKPIDPFNSTSKLQDPDKPYVAPLVLGPLINNPAADSVKQPKPVKHLDQEPFTSDWLLQQSPNAYTIQIVASLNQENLLAFAKKNLTDKQTAYYQQSGQDKQWFILVYGIFPTRAEALKALEALPPNLQKNGPYPKQISIIQQAIRQQ